MKSKQFCSVCKQWLEMEVVPTGDGDDDGVVWFRCPLCQGFLPKLSSQLEASPEAEAPRTGNADATEPVAEPAGDDLPWESPADMMAAQREQAGAGPAATEAPLAEDTAAEPAIEPEPNSAPAPAADSPGPLAEYAALLAEKDPTTAVPYRPWETYEVGQCVHHLAWDDCGVVVAKEDLPGGRHVIKCYFEAAGVVRLIERTPQ